MRLISPFPPTREHAMKRRCLLSLVAVAVMVAFAAMRAEKKSGLLVLEWAAKAPAEPPPAAVLIELGVKDREKADWSGSATVRGAKVVHREGYRFRAADKLVDPDRWQASSRPAIALPANNAAARRAEPFATVGVVLQLADIQPDATLIVAAGDQGRAEVPLKDVLGGQKHPIWDGKAVVRRVTAAAPVAHGKTEDDFPAAAYGPDGTLWIAYISYRLKEPGRRVRQTPLPEQPADFKAFYTPEYGDQLFVRCYRDGRFTEPVAVTGPHEDLVRCAIGVEGNGTAWVVYSAHRQGNFDLYARPLNRAGEAEPTAGKEQRLTRTPTPDLTPAICTDQAGRLHVACQSWTEETPAPETGGPRDCPARIALLTCKDGKWSEPKLLDTPKNGTNCWQPAVAAGPGGEVAVAYDVYADGDYDVHVAVLKDDQVTDYPVATSALFEARPSVVYDAHGRLWIAYEEGPEKWGLDYGALDNRDGNPLYNARSVRVVCLADGKLQKPAADLPTSVSQQRSPNEVTLRYAYPKVGLDGKGRLWLTYRQKFGTRNSSFLGSYWLTFARRLDGDHWTPPVEVHHSDGLLDSRPVLLPQAAGGLVIVTNTDGRYTTPLQRDIGNHVYAGTLDLPGDPVEPQLVAHEPGKKDEESLQRGKAERAAVKAIRAYRIENDGKKYQLLRGDFHRHTEISWDGGPDGSLEDFFRYARDVAAFDWIANTDHDNGGGREYSWWLTQKLTDAYLVPNVFTPIFAYERSVSYPHGHRNVMFARRGILTLPRLAEPDQKKRVAGVHADDTKMLYRYLKELGGICASHTSATGMGTDWRDNDPNVEPVVEIYQGDRNSYEYPDAPRAGHDPQGNKLPLSIGGWQPKGFINLAFQKGYRLGFQSSSDHWSTHISYCIILAEKHDRQGLIDALKKRHCYAATDNIIVDVRSGRHIMGDEFTTDGPAMLDLRVHGTKPIVQIDVLKDSDVVATIKPGRIEYQGTWTDPKPTGGVHYYYIRVLQEDEELAWSSPLWIGQGQEKP
jgi:hypothetical protein